MATRVETIRWVSDDGGMRRSIDALSRRAEVVKGALTAIGGAVGAALSVSSRRVDAARAEIASATGATGKALDALVQGSARVRRQTGADLGDVARAMGTVQTATGLAADEATRITRAALDAGVPVRHLGTALAGTAGDADEAATRMDLLAGLSQAYAADTGRVVERQGRLKSQLSELGLSWEQQAAALAIATAEGRTGTEVVRDLRDGTRDWAAEADAAVEALGPLAGRAEEVGNAGRTMSDRLQGALGYLDGLVASGGQYVALVPGLVAGLGAASGAVGGLGTALHLSTGGLTLLVGAIVAAGAAAWRWRDELRDALGGVVDWVRDRVAGVLAYLASLAEGAANLVGRVSESAAASIRSGAEALRSAGLAVGSAGEAPDLAPPGAASGAASAGADGAGVDRAAAAGAAGAGAAGAAGGDAEPWERRFGRMRRGAMRAAIAAGRGTAQAWSVAFGEQATLGISAQTERSIDASRGAAAASARAVGVSIGAQLADGLPVGALADGPSKWSRVWSGLRSMGPTVGRVGQVLGGILGDGMASRVLNVVGTALGQLASGDYVGAILTGVGAIGSAIKGMFGPSESQLAARESAQAWIESAQQTLTAREKDVQLRLIREDDWAPDLAAMQARLEVLYQDLGRTAQESNDALGEYLDAVKAGDTERVAEIEAAWERMREERAAMAEEEAAEEEAKRAAVEEIAQMDEESLARRLELLPQLREATEAAGAAGLKLAEAWRAAGDAILMAAEKAAAASRTLQSATAGVRAAFDIADAGDAIAFALDEADRL